MRCVRFAQARARIGWTASAFIPVVSQALGGIIVGLVTKRLGGISKGFAIVGGLVLTGALQSAVEGRLLSAELYVALALVICRRAARPRAACVPLTRRAHVLQQHLDAWTVRCEEQAGVKVLKHAHSATRTR